MPDEQREQLKYELDWSREEIRNREIEMLGNARFVATTIAKQQLDPDLFRVPFDTVIVDEASMLDVPSVLHAASHAKQSFVCLGDFRQLAPITFTKSGLLNMDLFQYTGISRAVSERKGHRWLTMLDEQYRMPPLIGSLISQTMYDGLLKTPLAKRLSWKKEQSADSLQDQALFEKPPLLFLDLSGFSDFEEIHTHRSRMALLSALLSRLPAGMHRREASVLSLPIPDRRF